MIIHYVAEHPGCSKWDVAAHCTRDPRRDPSKQYALVNTALRNGWIAGKLYGRQYRLYVPDEESRRKVQERAERRRQQYRAQPSLRERFAGYQLVKRCALLVAMGWTVRTEQRGCWDCLVIADGLYLSFRSIPTVQEVRQRQAEVQRQQQEENERRLAEYQFKVDTCTPFERIRFDAEGGFSTC
jgi:hypothetical protein